jgi:hypothetical protein
VVLEGKGREGKGREGKGETYKSKNANWLGWLPNSYTNLEAR